MAIAFDAASSGHGNDGGGAGISLSHTCAGADRFLSCVAQRWGGSGDALTATYNAVSLSLIWDIAAHKKVFFLVAPATGTNTLQVASVDTSNEVIAVAASYTGVDQTTPYDGLATSSTLTATPSVTVTSATGNQVLGGVIGADDGGTLSFTPGADQTERVDHPGANPAACTIADEAGAASVTHSYTLSSSPAWDCNIFGVNLRAAGGAVQLVVQDAGVGIAADSPALIQQALLTVAGADVAIAAESPSLLPKHTLGVSDATVGISAESPAVTEKTPLTVAEATVAIAADQVALTQKALLAVADALVSLAADSPALTQKNLLTVADSTVGVSAENVTLSNAMLLVVADALVAIAAEAPALTQQHLLAIQDALVAIGAESPALTQANVLAVQGADVAITVDPITLSNALLLTVADAAVAITVDGIVLSPADVLAVQGALLAITAESPGLVQANLLAVNDALVALTVGGLVLVLPSAAVTGKYGPEHAAALAALGEARSFAADHAGAFRDIGTAGSGS
jgi:hypothetical protein